MENQAQTVTHDPDVTACDLEDIFAKLRFYKMPSLDVLFEMLEKAADDAEVAVCFLSSNPNGLKEVREIESVVWRIHSLIQAGKTVYSGICHEVYMLEEAVCGGGKNSAIEQAA